MFQYEPFYQCCQDQTKSPSGYFTIRPYTLENDVFLLKLYRFLSQNIQKHGFNHHTASIHAGECRIMQIYIPTPSRIWTCDSRVTKVQDWIQLEMVIQQTYLLQWFWFLFSIGFIASYDIITFISLFTITNEELCLCYCSSWVTVQWFQISFLSHRHCSGKSPKPCHLLAIS